MEDKLSLGEISLAFTVAFAAVIFAIVLTYVGTGKGKKVKEQTVIEDDYKLETYKDDKTGITMLIFKDELGEVIYCQPVVMEMETK